MKLNHLHSIVCKNRWYVGNGTYIELTKPAVGQCRKISSLYEERFFSSWELDSNPRTLPLSSVLALSIREDVGLEQVRSSFFT